MAKIFYVFSHDLCLRRDFSVAFHQNICFHKRKLIINYVITNFYSSDFLPPCTAPETQKVEGKSFRQGKVKN